MLGERLFSQRVASGHQCKTPKPYKLGRNLLLSEILWKEDSTVFWRTTVWKQAMNTDKI